MIEVNFKEAVALQRQFFATGQTLPLKFRIEQLKKLKKLLKQFEPEIVSAISKDLRKSPIETIITDILLTLKELDTAISHLKKWAKPLNVSTPLSLKPGRSFICTEPYGCTLIIGTWNYPFILVMMPLIGAMSAGNCAMIKPSDMTFHTTEIILKVINQHFPPEYLLAINTSNEKTESLLQEKFDYIFFTGSTRVGRIVMEAAAKHLTPVTLELGGKSPCIIDETADLDFAARRIAWAKTINAGQTCIAPDYVYIHHTKKQAFIEKIKNAFVQFYGDMTKQSKHYSSIINQNHFNRLIHLLQNGRILEGGITDANDCYISPTLMDNVSWNDAIMQEEIFGPLLPILTFSDLHDIIPIINARPKPLALYLFTKNNLIEKTVLNRIAFGGGCINDCVTHFVNLHLPFGGTGQSGMGRYHGRYTFETFSYRKGIYKKIWPFEWKLEYPPYTYKKFWFLRKLF